MKRLMMLVVLTIAILASSARIDAQTPKDEAATVEAWLKGYDAAFTAKDLDKLAAFYHPDVTIYEGGGVNNGWIDYRDHHLGPELKAFENLQFGHVNTKVSILPGGLTAYATSEYFIKTKMGDRQIDSTGLETLVLIKPFQPLVELVPTRENAAPPRVAPTSSQGAQVPTVANVGSVLSRRPSSATLPRRSRPRISRQ
jgi:ketosteroid isomerase-like protein